MKAFSICLVCGVAALNMGVAALAQPVPLPPASPATVTPETSRPDARVIEPVGAAEQSEQRRELLREGAFLSRAKGELRRLPSGRWAFIFNPDAGGAPKLPPMIVLPCMGLSAMQQIVETRREAASFAVSGQVYIYDNANYLLPTDHATVSDDQQTSAAHAAGTAPLRAPESVGDETVDALIRGLDEAAPKKRVARSAPAQAPEVSGLTREGETLVLRQGRITRGANGWMEFKFDNDADAGAVGASDRAMALLPCLNVQSMERMARERGEGSPFLVSGRVFVYEGRNYLLPTMFQVVADVGGNLTPAQ